MRIVLHKGTSNLYGKSVSVIKIVSVLCAILCLYLGVGNDSIGAPIYILAIQYSISLFIFTKNFDRTIAGPGVLTLNVVMFIRFAIQPLLLYLNGQLSRFAPNYSYLNKAVYLMMYEQLSYFITLEITARYYKNKQVTKNVSNGEKNIYYMKNAFFLAVVVCGMLMLLAFSYNSLVGGLDILVEQTKVLEAEYAPGYITIIWSVLYSWLYLYFINIEYMKYIKNRKDYKCVYRSIIYSYILILLAFMGNVRISRWYTVVTAVAAISILLKLYPKKIKTILFSVLLPAGLFVMILSLYKNTSYLSSGELNSSFNQIVDSTIIDSYFAGPVGVNNAIGLMEHNQTIGMHSITYDLMKNFPILNHYVDTTGSVADAYCSYVNRKDLIVPLIGQSAIYFGYVFSPLLGVLSVVLIRIVDYKYKNSYSFMTYVYAFCGIWTGLISVLNLKIFASWIYSRIIPMIIVLWVCNKMSSVIKVDRTEIL